VGFSVAAALVLVGMAGTVLAEEALKAGRGAKWRA
jgi:hypothetical protein